MGRQTSVSSQLSYLFTSKRVPSHNAISVLRITPIGGADSGEFREKLSPSTADRRPSIYP